jgi:N-6 DNA Methylase/HsdM N-terminal domain
VPTEARWSYLQGRAKQPTIGKDIDDAMEAIERDNPSLRGVLPKDYARPHLDKQRLGELIDLIANITVGDQASRSKDVLGRVYEYFLSQFATAEGKKGGQFYTPRCVVPQGFPPRRPGWRDWEPLGGQLTSGPSATANSGNRIDIVVRGLNDEAWHMAWDGSKWADWESLGGSAISDPAICSLGSGQLDVFTVGTDKALIHKAYRPDDQGWRNWESLGGTLTSSPFVEAWLHQARGYGCGHRRGLRGLRRSGAGLESSRITMQGCRPSRLGDLCARPPAASKAISARFVKQGGLFGDRHL